MQSSPLLWQRRFVRKMGEVHCVHWGAAGGVVSKRKTGASSYSSFAMNICHTPVSLLVESSMRKTLEKRHWLEEGISETYK